MSARSVPWFLIGLLVGAGPSWADPPAKPAATSLEQHLDQLDQVDRELAEASQALSTSKGWGERRRLRRRIQELQATQERLLQEIERLAGPLPPAVPPDVPISLEEQLERRQRHHEALLESNVDQRLRAK